MNDNAAVDEWLAETEAEHGPVPPEALEWAVQIFDAWEGGPADRVTIAPIQP